MLIIRSLYTEHSVTSLSILSQKEELLDEGQRIALKHVKELNSDVSSEAIREMLTSMESIAKEVDEKLMVVLTGNCRREVPARQIEILITHPELATAKNKLDKIVGEFLDALKSHNDLFQIMNKTSSKCEALIIPRAKVIMI